MQPIGQVTPNLFSDACPKSFIKSNLPLPAFLIVFPLLLTGVYLGHRFQGPSRFSVKSHGTQGFENLTYVKCFLLKSLQWLSTHSPKNVNSFSFGFLSWVIVSNHHLIFLYRQFINIVIKAYSPGFWNLCEISNCSDLNSRKTFKKSLFPHQRNSFKFQV